MHAYIVSGLSVVSDLALPGLIARPEAPAEPEVAIRAGDVPATIDGATAGGPNWQIAGDRFLIEIPGIIRMLLTAGREILFALQGETTPEDAAIFVSGTGFGILLHQRGRIVLHGSAMRIGNHAVLFCGPSGAGKSTLAAALGDRGYDLVTDDFCAVDIRDGRPWIEPDGRQHKLWQHSIDRLDLAGRRAAAVRTTIEKFYVEPRGATSTALPVAAVYGLREARLPLLPGIERPNIVDAALLVRRNAYRPVMVDRMGQRELYFGAAALIAQRAGVFTLTRTLDFDRMAEVIGWLEEHWATHGIEERAA